MEKGGMEDYWCILGASKRSNSNVINVETNLRS